MGAQSVAGNKITLAKRLGSTLPPGLIANAEGTPIMDAAPVPDEFMILPTGVRNFLAEI